MQPPICELCGVRFDSSAGDLVRFANYESLPDGVCGHPKGLLWFCERHCKAAQALCDHSSAEALKRMRRKYWISCWFFRVFRPRR